MCASLSVCVSCGGSLRRSSHLHASCLDLLDDALHAQADVGDLRVEHILQKESKAA